MTPPLNWQAISDRAMMALVRMSLSHINGRDAEAHIRPLRAHEMTVTIGRDDYKRLLELAAEALTERMLDHGPRPCDIG